MSTFVWISVTVSILEFKLYPNPTGVKSNHNLRGGREGQFGQIAFSYLNQRKFRLRYNVIFLLCHV